MTVKELMAHLGTFPHHMPIVTDGHCDGFAEDVVVVEVYLKRDGHRDNDRGIYGRHERVSDDATTPDGDWNMKALCIGKGAHIHSGA
jgi:hypothetical protein